MRILRTSITYRSSPNNLFNFLESKKFSFAQIFCKFALEFSSYLCDFLALGEEKNICVFLCRHS
jgi:hypothetical protein